jgi:hypothetical protein
MWIEISTKRKERHSHKRAWFGQSGKTNSMQKEVWQDVLQNTFGAIRLHCGSNNNPSVGQSVDSLKTLIISGLACRDLLNPNCKDDGATLLDNLHSCLKPSVVSSPSQSISHDRQTTDYVLYIVHANEAQEGVRTAMCAGDIKMFLVAYVSGLIARRLLCNGSCDACKACLISEIPSTTDVYRLQAVQQYCTVCYISN